MQSAEKNHFEEEHARIGAMLHAHLLDVIGADFIGALQRFQIWLHELRRHIDIENTQLLPHLPERARWPARMYLLEHDRILLLAEEYLAKLAATAHQPPAEETARRETVLHLLDSAHALRHLMEHHNQREEMALAHELPLEVQQLLVQDRD